MYTRLRASPRAASPPPCAAGPQRPLLAGHVSCEPNEKTHSLHLPLSLFFRAAREGPLSSLTLPILLLRLTDLVP